MQALFITGLIYGGTGAAVVGLIGSQATGQLTDSNH